MSSLPNRAKYGNDSVPVNSSASGRVSLRERVRQAARQMESEIIMEALEQHRWNRRRTAEALRISYRSLMYKMKICNLRDGAAGHRTTAN
jgi:two-component system, NtrC family, response regulator AtoC